MNINQINKIVEELPSNDPEFVIGWLIAQLEHVTTELDKAHVLIHVLRKDITYN